LAALGVSLVFSESFFLGPFPRFLSGTSVDAVRHVKEFIDDGTEISKKHVPTETDLVDNVSHEEEIDDEKAENKDIQPSAHSDNGEASLVPTHLEVNHGEPKMMTTKHASQEESEHTVDVEEKVAEPLKPEQNHGEPNKTIAKIALLGESENTVNEKGKVAVPLKPEGNHGEPKEMAEKPASQGESENTVNEEGKVAVPSKPEETHDEPKVTATKSASPGESDNTVDEEGKVAVPSKPKETHDEPKGTATKSESQGESVSTVDGDRKGGKGEPESTGKKGDDNESSNKVANTKKKLSFDRIVLLGERHSGTSYTRSMLQRCFPSLHVDDFLVRYKHWFQPDPDFVVDISKKYLTQKGVAREGDMFKIVNQWPKIAALDDPKSAAFKNTLVIVMFRNAYDWLGAMKEGPHHWPNHYKLYRYNKPIQDNDHTHYYGSNFLPWKQFVAANLTLGATNAGVSQLLCQNAFPVGTVSPCIKSKETYPPDVKKDFGSDLSAAPDLLPFNGHNPMYELDANGKPFNHPLELRTAKIKDVLDKPNKWDLGGYMILQHEEINMKGTGFLLEQVSKIVGMKPSCNADPPRRQPSKKLANDWTKWISEHADWETEAKVGYERRPGAQPVKKNGANHDVSEKNASPNRQGRMTTRPRAQGQKQMQRTNNPGIELDSLSLSFVTDLVEGRILDE
jgi:hypothetical protein